jgi:CheY-like chemotaxis protein
LAGGIAHDFNNLLTVINGYSDLLLSHPDTPAVVRQGLQEIQSAGTRGAELTQQLLAFSRKQVTQLRPLDLNRLIQECESMLQRVIGEDVRMVVMLDSAAGTVKADRGQMHQVLMNLVVNGREAMPHGGVLTIETRNAELSGDLRERASGSAARPFVLLRVSDTGVGMDARVKQHLFEPFFTTKRSRKGIGLGLSTVFGIVTQAGGQISVASEPGMGSTFSIYLPRIASPAPADPLPRRVEAVRGSGSILVVEDEAEVRRFTCEVLRNLGYEVHAAAGGAEALELVQRLEQPLRLLLTDVIMPGMNGRQLADLLSVLQPQMKIVYMSGYTDRIMSEDGVIDPSVAFLEKPFTPERLGRMVYRVLESG